MSAGQAAIYVLVALVALDSIAFLALMGAVIIEAVAEVLRVSWQEVAAAITCVACAAFFVWFVLGCPGMERFEAHAQVGGYYELRDGMKD